MANDRLIVALDNLDEIKAHVRDVAERTAGEAASMPLTAAHDDGWDKPPDRYMTTGRETIDQIRDALGDVGFVAYCIGNAMKYRSRAGSKEGATLEQDTAKAEWYETMARHVMSPAAHPDPRARYGKGYTPPDVYSAQTTGLHAEFSIWRASRSRP